jgi:polyhydroxybutyrate depolymerase
MRWDLEWMVCVAFALACGAAGCSSKKDDHSQDMAIPMTGSGGGGAVGNGSGGTNAGTGGSGPGPVTSSGSGGATGSGGTTGSGGSAAPADDMDGGTLGPDAGGGTPANDGGSSSGPKCTAPALAAGDHMMMLDHDGQSREYTVHVPAKYDGSKNVPLVLDFHGWTSNPMEEQKGGSDMLGSGWSAKSDEIGFIVVYPQGLDDSWNGGALCCGTSQSSGVDDQGFAVAIVEKMKQDACIDPKRVYVTGISNGGAMSHLLACKEADVFAASAPVSMGNGTTPCMPSRPISVVMFRGEMDTAVPYNGGTFPSAMADFDMWKDIDGCTGSSTMTHTYCETYTQCMEGTEVTLCSLPMSGHVVYDDDAEINVPDVAWEAFERQVLP